ncbi:hypothetical protein ALC56_00963 [Trachymyrmex septentrionalis]|uniref:Uncharacterized protein n=1 Tax=Trachymyrmex septentrionalis TaxID=34720 RepID=A0A195FV52_9HYME|nr:hypothetical protein ALC56_00963 [Trachymyrmex septentrionalis]
MYLQYGALSSSKATFLSANLAASIIFCGSEFDDKVSFKQPSLTSSATRPIPARVNQMYNSYMRTFGCDRIAAESPKDDLLKERLAAGLR